MYTREDVMIRRKAIEVIKILEGLTIKQAREALGEAESFIMICMRVDTVNNDDLKKVVANANEMERDLKRLNKWD
ncbi:MAG: hypothetical protein HY889_10345 [Deltaproteobacteria bacterium]|nr:hypothetical protein [Deltaproteobacteria bacterium]